MFVIVSSLILTDKKTAAKMLAKAPRCGPGIRANAPDNPILVYAARVVSGLTPLMRTYHNHQSIFFIEAVADFQEEAALDFQAPDHPLEGSRPLAGPRPLAVLQASLAVAEEQERLPASEAEYNLSFLILYALPIESPAISPRLYEHSDRALFLSHRLSKPCHHRDIAA
jgi:hypothetical protein